MTTLFFHRPLLVWPAWNLSVSLKEFLSQENWSSSLIVSLWFLRLISDFLHVDINEGHLLLDVFARRNVRYFCKFISCNFFSPDRVTS